jgi:hypothetical protein
MPSNRDIATVLNDDLLKARERHLKAVAEFDTVTADFPSGIPEPDGAFRIRKAGAAQVQTHQAWIKALQRFSDFTLRGIIPEDLEPKQKQASAE